MKLPVIKLSDQSKEQISTAIWRTLGVFVLFYIAHAIASAFQREPGAIQGIVHMAIALFGLRYFLRSFQFSPQECGIIRPKLGFTDIGLILLILAAFTGLILSFPGQLVWSGLSRAEMLTILSYAVYNGIKSPVVEELFFRGFLFKMYQNYWGKTAAVLLTSLVFTLPHLRGNLSPQQYLISFICYFTFSLLLVFLRLYDGHVWGCVLLHNVWNVVLGHNFVVRVSTQINRDAFLTYLIDPSLVTDSLQLKHQLGLFGIALVGNVFVIAALYFKKRKANQRA